MVVRVGGLGEVLVSRVTSALIVSEEILEQGALSALALLMTRSSMNLFQPARPGLQSYFSPSHFDDGGSGMMMVGVS